ncbi:hypothetical protein [Streptomyces rubiginosohelvolus]|uniref:hypothetical protein n=1 Tax=Streptomyces rubiginosohelvolus TaxID=67362 RepID=UPI00339E9757
MIAVTGGTAAELPGIAAELTGSFHRKDDAGAPPPPGPASACVAVEDSPDGTASTHAAGCAVLVVLSLRRSIPRGGGPSPVAWKRWISGCSATA